MLKLNQLTQVGVLGKKGSVGQNRGVLYSLALMSSLGLASISSPAAAKFADHFDLHPYIGADAQVWNIKTERGYGDTLFQRNPFQGSGYVGLKLNKHVGVETGGEYSKQNFSKFVGNNEFFLGKDSDIDRTIFSGDLKKTSWFARIVGFLPLDKEDKIQLIGSVGLKKVNLKLKLKAVERELVISPSDAQEIGVGNVLPNGFISLPINPVYEATTFKQDKKVIPCLGIGLQYAFNKNLAVRVGTNWEYMNKAGKLSGFVQPDDSYEARLQNNLVYSAGFYFTF